MQQSPSNSQMSIGTPDYPGCAAWFQRSKDLPEPEWGGKARDRGTAIHAALAFLVSAESTQETCLEDLKMFPPAYEALTAEDANLAGIPAGYPTPMPEADLAVVVKMFKAFKATFPQFSMAATEIKLDLSTMGFKPSGRENEWQVDVLAATPDGLNILVVDWKTGSTEPEPPAINSQLKIYGTKQAELNEVRTVTLALIGGEWSTPVLQHTFQRDELRAWWANTARPAIEEAEKGGPARPNGKLCRFCRARQTCAEYAQKQSGNAFAKAESEEELNIDFARLIAIDPEQVKMPDELVAFTVKPPVLISQGLRARIQELKSKIEAFQVTDADSNAVMDAMAGRANFMLKSLEKRRKAANEPAASFKAAVDANAKEGSEPLKQIYDLACKKLKDFHDAEMSRLKREKEEAEARAAADRKALEDAKRKADEQAQEAARLKAEADALAKKAAEDAQAALQAAQATNDALAIQAAQKADNDAKEAALKADQAAREQDLAQRETRVLAAQAALNLVSTGPVTPPPALPMMAPASKRSTKMAVKKKFEVTKLDEVPEMYITREVNTRLLQAAIDTGTIGLGDYPWGRVYEDSQVSAKGR